MQPNLKEVEMLVKLAELGKMTRDVTVEGESASMQEVLDAAEVVLQEDTEKGVKDEVLLNGEQITDMNTRVAEGAIITIVPKVKGGRS